MTMKKTDTQQRMETDVGFEEDEELLLNRKDTKVWLVKVPNFLFEQWTTITEPNVDIGRLCIYKESVYIFSKYYIYIYIYIIYSNLLKN